MSTIIVSKVPVSVTTEKLTNFFSFCGKVDSVTPQPDASTESKTYEIHFESPKALSTALLLNDAELDGISIQVVEKPLDLTATGVAPPAYAEGENKPDLTGDNKVQSTKTGDNEYDDISQEEKPKYAIMAQLLANGYVVSDKVINHAIEADKKNGYSSRFHSFVSNLDEKYIHSQVPGTTANKNLVSAQGKLTDLQTQLTNKYSKTLSKYFERATSHPYGMKIHEFYKGFAKDVQAVHKEATRLAELQKAAEAEAEANAAAAISSEAKTETKSDTKPEVTAPEPVTPETTKTDADPVSEKN
jgi:hypothetical protein